MTRSLDPLRPPYLDAVACIHGVAAWHLSRAIDRDEVNQRLIECGVPERNREAALAALEAIVLAGKEAANRHMALRSENRVALQDRPAESLDLMSAAEAALALGVTAQQVRNLARSGQLGLARQTSGGRWLIPAASVRALANKRKDRP